MRFSSLKKQRPLAIYERTRRVSLSRRRLLSLDFEPSGDKVTRSAADLLGEKSQTPSFDK